MNHSFKVVFGPRWKPWAAIFFFACGVSAASAQTTDGTRAKAQIKKSDQLDEIVVTGSLIPQVRSETATPVTIITADDIQQKGFSTIADALQHNSFSTGAVQGAQFSGGFTQGAQTISLFGLSPSYTKYLIDGRPIADYPALYNGTDIITSISGIPTVLVDHIDILPGGQSSIYGSDAIAGVINISLKKSMDGAEADLRYGWTKDGGATERRVGIADGFNVGRVKILVGGQYEKTDPIWGYQRPLTDQYFAGGSSPQVAERDWLITGLNGQANGDTYYFLDPANCANIAGQFGNTLSKQHRVNRGTFCGTTRSGFYTINNGTEGAQGFLRLSDDINDNLQLFADVLLDHDVTRFNTGTVSLQTAADSAGPYNYFSDPNVPGDLLNLQRVFSPEEVGNFRGQGNKDTINSVRSTLGAQGSLGSSAWKYLLDMTYTENKLTETTHLAFSKPINNFFSSIFGPNLGPDPVSGQPQYAVNYAAFYSPLTPAQYASFTGSAISYSRTEDSLVRAQVTNSSLFTLPGGDAGIAVLLEGGRQGWEYDPDLRFLDQETYLYTATSGSGHRTRYGNTVELRLPLVKMLTVDLSNRYDDYQVPGGGVSKDTYNIGVEFRPLSRLLLRGRYGTAFKSPTLSDEFQGKSGFFQSVTDYYHCAQLGFSEKNGNLAQCNYTIANGPQIFGTTSGNPKLKPINAKVTDLGIVWSPLDRTSISLDLFHWKITNEVQQQPSDLLLRTESACRLGDLPIASPTCVEALSLVTRDANGIAIQISTPKENLAQETLNVATLSFNYTAVTAAAGNFLFDGAYSNVLKHAQILFPGDAEINLLESPFYSTEFKTKENLSVTWNFADFGTTLYVEHYGRTANYAAQQTVQGYAAPLAGNVGTWTVANLSAKYQLSSGLVVSGNMNNVFNKMPPYDASQPGFSNQPFSVFNYNNFGRSFFVEANYKFGKQ